MNRLTMRNSDGTVSQPTSTTVEAVFYRLAEYEDTGLSPEDLRELRKLVDFDQLKELLQAEAEGRLVVLPCKAGDTVWFIGTECDKTDCWDYGDYCHRDCKKWKIPKVRETTIRQFRLLGNQFDAMTDTTALASTTDNYFYLRDMGKTVFLSREEAEAALKGGDS